MAKKESADKVDATPTPSQKSSGRDQIISRTETIAPEIRPVGDDPGVTGDTDVKGIRITATPENPNPVSETARFAESGWPAPAVVPVDPPRGVVDLSRVPDPSRIGTDFADPRTLGNNRASGDALVNPSLPRNVNDVGGKGIYSGSTEATPAASQVPGNTPLDVDPPREMPVRAPASEDAVQHDPTSASVLVPSSPIPDNDPSKTKKLDPATTDV